MHRLPEESAVRPWLIAWIGGAGIGILNGITREKAYGKAVGEMAAHQISTVTGIAAFAAYFAALDRVRPIPTAGEARRIGAAWLGLTVIFEFCFGRLVAKMTWRELLADYNLSRGRTWPLVLAWLAAGPGVIRRLRRG